MNLDRLTEYLTKFKHELEAAENKHQKFCDTIIDPTSSISWAISENKIKLRNTQAPYCADNILMEEISEAMAAYQQGDKANALQELAQCGAVILRMMGQIEKEMNDNG